MGGGGAWGGRDAARSRTEELAQPGKDSLAASGGGPVTSSGSRAAAGSLAAAGSRTAAGSRAAASSQGPRFGMRNLNTETPAVRVRIRVTAVGVATCDRSENARFSRCPFLQRPHSNWHRQGRHPDILVRLGRVRARKAQPPPPGTARNVPQIEGRCGVCRACLDRARARVVTIKIFRPDPIVIKSASRASPAQRPGFSVTVSRVRLTYYRGWNPRPSETVYLNLQCAPEAALRSHQVEGTLGVFSGPGTHSSPPPPSAAAAAALWWWRRCRRPRLRFHVVPSACRAARCTQRTLGLDARRTRTAGAPPRGRSGRRVPRARRSRSSPLRH